MLSYETNLSSQGTIFVDDGCYVTVVCILNPSYLLTISNGLLFILFMITSMFMISTSMEY